MNSTGPTKQTSTPCDATSAGRVARWPTMRSKRGAASARERTAIAAWSNAAPARPAIRRKRAISGSGERSPSGLDSPFVFSLRPPVR